MSEDKDIRNDQGAAAGPDPTPRPAQPSFWARQTADPGPPSQDSTASPPPPVVPPPGPHTQPAPQSRPPRALRRLAVTGAAAVVLAVGSGLLGGIVATQLDDDATGGSPTAGTGQPAAQLDPASLAGIVEQVQPSVVSITTDTGSGSGVVLDTEGSILTNNHVVATARGDSVSVDFSDGTSAAATIVGTDERSDLAVVDVDDVDGLVPASFGDSDAMRIGDAVLALGSPLGLEGSVTSGIISAKDRTIQVGGQQRNPFGQQGAVTSISGMLQTDAAINSGNSGGALVNLNGEVIGINSAIATSGNSTGNIGVGFAIPANTASDVASQLINGEDVSHAYLGVSIANAQGGGALVREVAAGGPADRAGLAQGDVITSLDGTTINEPDDLVSAVQARGAGDEVSVTYTRDGQEQQATVTLTEAP
jgi:putative serine protease PepD